VTGGPVETFLAELAHQLRRAGDTRRRVVAEVGDHLRDLVAEGRARGLDEHTAELEAVDRFGSPRAFARAVRPTRRRTRSLRAGAAVIAFAVAGGAFAFSRLGDTPPRAAPSQAPVAPGAPSGTPDRCLAEILANRSMQMLEARLAHQANAVESQMLLQVGTRVALDPRTGRVLSCRPAGVNGRNDGVWLVVTNPYGPFG
jgi:hypothetical protein